MKPRLNIAVLLFKQCWLTVKGTVSPYIKTAYSLCQVNVIMSAMSSHARPVHTVACNTSTVSCRACLPTWRLQVADFYSTGSYLASVRWQSATNLLHDIPIAVWVTVCQGWKNL